VDHDDEEQQIGVQDCHVASFQQNLTMYAAIVTTMDTTMKAVVKRSEFAMKLLIF
jgi:hypothetical protein